MTQRIEFNTGRYYGPEGQPITAEVISQHEDDEIEGMTVTRARFADPTRMIWGEIEFYDDTLTQYNVMKEYDKGRYQIIPSF